MDLKHTLLPLAASAFFSMASAETVKVGDTDVTIETPSGFKPLTQDQIAERFPGNRAPTFVIGNLTAMTTIAFDVKKEDLPQTKLPEVQASFKKVFERIIPDIVWVKNEMIEISGQKWIYMEMTSTSPEVDIHNIVLLSGYKDHSILFNFNSTTGDFPKLEAEIRASVKSVKIPTAPVPDTGFPKPE